MPQRPTIAPSPAARRGDDYASASCAVLYRQLTVGELPAVATHGRRIARIVRRGDLRRAASTLS